MTTYTVPHPTHRQPICSWPAFAVLLMLMALPQLTSAQIGFSQTGTASYYADYFHGKFTASGEPYDKSKYTCAHPNLPFNAMLKVTNLSNGKSVIVRVNDRGPHSGNRIIDISKVAAQDIDMIAAGVLNVKVEVVGLNGQVQKPDPKPDPDPVEKPEIKPDPKPDPKPEPKPEPKPKPVPPPLPDKLESAGFYNIKGEPQKFKGWTLQLGTFSAWSGASEVAEKLWYAGFKEPIIYVLGDNPKNLSYKLLYGSFGSQAEASTLKGQLQDKGFASFAVDIKPYDVVAPGKPGNEKPYTQTGTYATTGDRIFPAQVGAYGIQVGSYNNLKNAQEQAGKIGVKGFSNVFIQVMQQGAKSFTYKVIVGVYESGDAAAKQVPDLEKKGIKGFVIKHL